MYKSYPGILVIFSLFFLNISVHADSQGEPRFRNSDGWRLGERVRDGYAIYRRSGRGWYRVPGSAIAVADGWVLGSKRESGGFAIYRWNGHGWDQAPGGAVDIGGNYRRPWVVNDRGHRYVWNGIDWSRDHVFRPRAGRRYGGDWKNHGSDRDRHYRDQDRRRRDIFKRQRPRFNGSDRRRYHRYGPW